MGHQWNDGGYSSEVDAYVLLGDKKLQIAQIGPKSFILRDHCDISPGTEGTIVISVDGRERKIHAILQNGAVNGFQEVQYV